MKPLRDTTEVDQALIRRVRQGEPQAFARLVTVFRVRVRRLAQGFFRSPFEQEDAVQEAFLLLWRRRMELDPLRVETVPGFIATLARRRMIDLIRARGGVILEELEAQGGFVDEGPSPDEVARNRQLTALLTRFEEKLKPSFQPFFRAVFVEGQDPQDARKALGIGTLRAKYLKRVLLARLRKHLPVVEALTGERSSGGTSP